MKYTEQPWVVLFGGAGREEIIKLMLCEGIHISIVLAPKNQSKKLEGSIAAIRNLGVTLKTVGKNELLQALSKYQKGNMLSVGYPYIIPKSIYAQYRVALNVHPTLLPKYRGPTTGAYILINNETESGSTVHFLSEEADKGDIVLQSYVPLTPFDTLRSLQRKVYGKEPALVVKAMRSLDDGIIPTHQNEALATSYPKVRKPEDSEINPNKSLLELFNEIRATDPKEFPAFFYYHGAKVNVKFWRDSKLADSEGEL